MRQRSLRPRQIHILRAHVWTVVCFDSTLQSGSLSDKEWGHCCHHVSPPMTSDKLHRKLILNHYLQNSTAWMFFTHLKSQPLQPRFPGIQQQHIPKVTDMLSTWHYMMNFSSGSGFPGLGPWISSSEGKSYSYRHQKYFSRQCCSSFVSTVSVCLFPVSTIFVPRLVVEELHWLHGPQTHPTHSGIKHCETTTFNSKAAPACCLLASQTVASGGDAENFW